MERNPSAGGAAQIPDRESDEIRKLTSDGVGKVENACAAKRNRKFADSPLEGTGFELPVPGRKNRYRRRQPSWE